MTIPHFRNLDKGEIVFSSKTPLKYQCARKLHFLNAISEGMYRQCIKTLTVSIS